MSSLTLPLNLLTHLNLRNIILKKNKITLNWPLRNYQYPRNYPVKYRSNNVGFDGCLSRSSPELGMNFHSACGLLVINLLFTVTVTLNATKRTRTVCDCLFKVAVENASGTVFPPLPYPPQMRNARFQLISTYFFDTHPSPLVVAFSGALQCRRSHLGLKCWAARHRLRCGKGKCIHLTRRKGRKVRASLQY